MYLTIFRWWTLIDCVCDFVILNFRIYIFAMLSRYLVYFFRWIRNVVSSRIENQSQVYWKRLTTAPKWIVSLQQHCANWIAPFLVRSLLPVVRRRSQVIVDSRNDGTIIDRTRERIVSTVEKDINAFFVVSVVYELMFVPFKKKHEIYHLWSDANFCESAVCMG